jgi:hypothetical protein
VTGTGCTTGMSVRKLGEVVEHRSNGEEARAIARSAGAKRARGEQPAGPWLRLVEGE